MEFNELSYLLVIAVAWAVSHTIKALIGIVKNNKFSFKYYVDSGGMPSAHTATTVSLTTLIGLNESISSPVFALAVVLLIIVAYDATHVRRAVGEQGELLRKSLKNGEKQPYFALGHTPFQVFIGALIGLAIGVATYYLI